MINIVVPIPDGNRGYILSIIWLPHPLTLSIVISNFNHFSCTQTVKLKFCSDIYYNNVVPPRKFQVLKENIFYNVKSKTHTKNNDADALKITT